MNVSTSRPKQRSLKLRTRVALGFIFLAILSSALILGISFFNFRSQLREALRQRLINIVTIAALQQDGDAFATIESDQDLEYEKLQKQNTNILNSDPDLAFVYTMRYDEEGLYFVVDAGDPAGPGFSPFGTRYLEPGPILAENFPSLSESLSETSFYSDEYGRFLSAYAPIKNTEGNVVGIIGADISANNIIAGERRLLMISLIIFGSILPVIGLVGWLLGSGVANPILLLADATQKISQGKLDFRPVIKTDIPEIVNLKTSFFTMADQQQELILNLEERVASRTLELSKASENIQLRASQLQAISEVAHTISAVQDPDTLLLSVTNLISSRFNFYHVGIFLTDKENEFAVLRAANSEGGRRMLDRGHRLKIGEVGIVGFVASKGQPRIALDVGGDSVFFNNPDLPETRSEMSLPLVLRDRIIGVLDIQSKETAAFKEEDIEVFKTLADQVAIAIENARLFSETKTSLEEAKKNYSTMVEQGWSNISKGRGNVGLRYSARGFEALTEQIDYPEIEQSEEGILSDESRKASSLVVPLKILGQSIGVLDIRSPGKKTWTDEEVSLVQRIVDRAALALENARLLEETSRRAEREKTISQITTTIRSSTDPQVILETALSELKRALGANIIEIHPYQPAEHVSAKKNQADDVGITG